MADSKEIPRIRSEGNNSTEMHDKEPESPPEGSAEEVDNLCRDMFSKLTEYLRGELEATAEDYKVLEKMNQVTAKNYAEMKRVVESVDTATKELNEKYKHLHPYLEKIDKIEESVTQLEQSAYRLDTYSKKLDARFRQLEKK